MTLPAVAPTATFALAPMRRGDLPAVAELERRSFAQPWSEALFARELRLPQSSILLARAVESGDLAGYGCRWLLAGELQIQNVAVAPEWRRRGLGGRLVEALLADGRGRGATRALLEVRRHNAPAIALYENLGFRAAGVRRDYYAPGEDAILMERELRP